MASFSTIERKDLGSDGKVKRKYELPEATPESFSLKVAGGFLLATTMLVVKSIFFGSDDAEAKSKDKAERPGEQEQAQAVVIDGSELENLQVIEHHGQSNSFDGDQVADGASPGGSSRFRGTSNPEEYGDPAATQVFAPQLSTSNVVQLPTSNYRGTGSNQAVVDIAGDMINTGRPSNGGGGSSGSQSPDGERV